MRNFKKVIVAVLSAAIITTCTPVLTPSVSYAASATDYTTATEVELNKLHILALEGKDSETGESNYVWYKFNAAPETKIELIATYLEGGSIYCCLYDSSLKKLYDSNCNISKTVKLEKDDTYYLRFNSSSPSTKGSFMVKGIELTAEPTVAPTAEPTVAPTAKPTVAPTAKPTVAPTAEPTVAPTAEPTVAPTAEPTVTPTAKPTVAPTDSFNVDSDFWNEDPNNGSGVYDDELPVPVIKEVSNGSNRVNIVWSCSDTSDIDGYHIYRSSDGQTWNKLTTINDTEVEDYEDKDVTNGEGYGYIIRSYVNDSQSENSIPEYTCYLNKVNVKSVKSNASKKLTVKWSANDKSTGYQIRVSTTKSFTKTTTAIKNIDSKSKTTKTIGKLKGGKKYYVQIRSSRTYNGEIYYSEWSGFKSLKVKR